VATLTNTGVRKFENFREWLRDCYLTRKAATLAVGWLIMMVISVGQKVECCHSESCGNYAHEMCRNIATYQKRRCTYVSNLFYFRMTLYMFRTVFPSIIRSSRLYIQQQTFVKQQYMFDKCMLLYVLS